jgi:nitroimidazol reductase NimA-like FMN-containing flavoprotein (pyridoxamine 5'-phosphate oxidase superfamily)
MEETTATTLDGDEVDSMLGTGGTGVISLAAGDGPPVSRPVSYGFDAETGRFYFRLAVGPDSEKAPFVDGGAVSFVTYEQTEEGWRSVVATGHLDPTDEDDVDAEVLEGLRRVHIPLFDVFGEDTRNVEFQFVSLDPDSLTGRREAPTPE